MVGEGRSTRLMLEWALSRICHGGRNEQEQELAHDVLIITRKKPSQKTVRRHYVKWREEKSLPPRCDNPKCQFHTAELLWNGESLPLILDHINGNRCDNSAANLRLLCPNCDAQLPTRGGANRGRVVETHDGGYVLKNRDGSILAAATGAAFGTSSVTAVGIAKKSES